MAELLWRMIGAAALASVAALSPVIAAEGEGAGQGAAQFGNRTPKPGPLGFDRSPEMENVRRALEALSPEQRRRFGENMMRWSSLPPEEKNLLREREMVRQKYIEQEISAAIAASGLHLEGERRMQFVKRFSEERRKIEEQLRQEMMEKRKTLVRELVGRLKTEFAESKP